MLRNKSPVVKNISRSYHNTTRTLWDIAKTVICSTRRSSYYYWPWECLMLKSNSASNDLLQNTWWNYHTDLLHVFNVNNNEIVNIQRRPVVSIVKELVLFIYYSLWKYIWLLGTFTTLPIIWIIHNELQTFNLLFLIRRSTFSAKKWRNFFYFK